MAGEQLSLEEQVTEAMDRHNAWPTERTLMHRICNSMRQLRHRPQRLATAVKKARVEE